MSRTMLLGWPSMAIFVRPAREEVLADDGLKDGALAAALAADHDDAGEDLPQAREVLRARLSRIVAQSRAHLLELVHELPELIHGRLFVCWSVAPVGGNGRAARRYTCRMAPVLSLRWAALSLCASRSVVPRSLRTPH